MMDEYEVWAFPFVVIPILTTFNSSKHEQVEKVWSFFPRVNSRLKKASFLYHDPPKTT